MPESPAAATPYEVLGVPASASDEEIRRAYRRLLRQTHPDVGGSAERFHAVQRAWERIGTPADRAAYDGQRYRSATDAGEAAARPASAGGMGDRPSSRPRTRMHGHPGGASRQRFLSLMREWTGRGSTVDDPYAAELIRSAPREIRHALAKALAEEETARTVSRLGIGYTAWHDVDTERHPGDSWSRYIAKLDHVVLGPAGLFAVLSEDWGGLVQLRRGELEGDGIAEDEHPLQQLNANARALSKALKVRFTALVVVVPNDSLADAFTLPARGRHPAVVVLPRARLADLLRNGLPGMERGSFEKVFELRSRLQNGVRFVD